MSLLRKMLRVQMGKKPADKLLRQAKKKARELLLSPGKIIGQRPKSLLLTASNLARHVFIGGGSGNGKSFLLLLLLRQLMSQGEGLLFLDPHGDTARAALVWAAANGIDPSRIVFWKPGTDTSISFDPFSEVPEGLTDFEYQSALTSTVDRIISAFLSKVSLADQELMKRLKNWLGVILFAAGVNIDGRHLGLSDALILTNPAREEFEPIYQRVLPHLPPDYAAELTKLRDEPSSYVRDKWMESTINCLRDILRGPLVRLMFAQETRSFSMRGALSKKLHVLVDLSESDHLSRQQANIIGSLLLNFLISTARRVPEKERTDFYAIADEAESYISEDLRTAFSELRKFRVRVCISVQDLSCLTKGDLELKDKVLSQCGLQVNFQQQNPDDVEYLAKLYGYPNLDMTPLMAEQVMPDGYDWVDTESISVGISAQQSSSRSVTRTQTHSITRQEHWAESIQESVSRSLSDTESNGSSSGIGFSHSDGQAHGRSEGWTLGNSAGKTWSNTEGESSQHSSSQSEGETTSDSMTKSKGTSNQESNGRSRGENSSSSESEGHNGRTKGTSGAHTTAQNSSTAKGNSESQAFAQSRGANHSESESFSNGQTSSHSEGGSLTNSRGISGGNNTSVTASDSVSQNLGTNHSRAHGMTDGTSRATGRSSGNSAGESNGDSTGTAEGQTTGQGNSLTITRGKTPIARHKVKLVRTGSLVVSVQDQLYALMKILASLPERRLLCKVKGMDAPFLLDVHEVKDPYEEKGIRRSQAWREDDVRLLLQKIRAAHPFYFVPTADDQAARVARFLGVQPIAQDEEAEEGMAEGEYGF